MTSKKEKEEKERKERGDLINFKIPVSITDEELAFINEKLSVKIGKQKELTVLFMDKIREGVSGENKLVLKLPRPLTPEERQRFEAGHDLIVNLVMALLQNQIPTGIGFVTHTEQKREEAVTAAIETPQPQQSKAQKDKQGEKKENEIANMFLNWADQFK